MITIYSKEGCSYCVKAKDLLESYDMNYTEIKINEDDKARDFVVSKGHSTVPQLYVGDALLVEGGYNGLKQVPMDLLKQRIQLMGFTK